MKLAIIREADSLRAAGITMRTALIQNTVMVSARIRAHLPVPVPAVLVLPVMAQRTLRHIAVMRRESRFLRGPKRNYLITCLNQILHPVVNPMFRVNHRVELKLTLMV